MNAHLYIPAVTGPVFAGRRLHTCYEGCLQEVFDGPAFRAVSTTSAADAKAVVLQGLVEYVESFLPFVKVPWDSNLRCSWLDLVNELPAGPPDGFDYEDPPEAFAEAWWDNNGGYVATVDLNNTTSQCYLATDDGWYDESRRRSGSGAGDPLD